MYNFYNFRNYKRLFFSLFVEINWAIFFYDTIIHVWSIITKSNKEQRIWTEDNGTHKNTDTHATATATAYVLVHIHNSESN